MNYEGRRRIWKYFAFKKYPGWPVGLLVFGIILMVVGSLGTLEKRKLLVSSSFSAFYLWLFPQ